MHNPAAQSDSLGEYIELYNAGAGAVDLAGLVVRDDGSDAFVIDASVIVPSGAYAVLGKSTSAAPGAVDYVFGTGMTLSNSDDEVVLVLDGLVVDRAVYDARFPLAAGKSLELRTAALDASANDDPGAWCAASVGLGNGDFGSPGTASSCPP
jgi:hypothetical protein